MFNPRNFRLGTFFLSGLFAALMPCYALQPAFAAQEKDISAAKQEETPSCHRTTLREAIKLAREAIEERHRKAAEENAGDTHKPMAVDVLWAELDVTAVPRYYDILLFDEDHSYFARVDEASTRILNLTKPGERRIKEIEREGRPLYDTIHVRIEDVIAGALDSRPRGIPIAARLNAVYGEQPVYEVVLRMPPGNDLVLLVDGLSGHAIELENFE